MMISTYWPRQLEKVSFHDIKIRGWEEFLVGRDNQDFALGY